MSTLSRDTNNYHLHVTTVSISTYYPSTSILSKDETTAVNEVLSLQPKTKYVNEMIENKYGKLVKLKMSIISRPGSKINHVVDIETHNYF